MHMEISELALAERDANDLIFVFNYKFLALNFITHRCMLLNIIVYF
jgi:hypothetical protein